MIKIKLNSIFAYPTANSTCPCTMFPLAISTGQYLPQRERFQRKPRSSTPVPIYMHHVYRQYYKFHVHVHVHVHVDTCTCTCI